ncbi:MAG: cation diffusion facilitator family transporter [Cyanobacteria bacterium]|nr:cation diffusion facilitator family transporter [Cyanobacteriota bacterium]
MTEAHEAHADADHKGGHDHHSSFRQQSRSRLATVLLITVFFMIAEVTVGLQSGSLALLADAGHMLSDIGGITLALIALWFSSKPASPEKTFGYYRSEILAGFVNSIVLIGISLFIFYEAYQRIIDPPAVTAGPVLAVAIIGIVINLVSLKLLRGDADKSINVRAAYFEVLADLLGLFGVVVSSVTILLTGWQLIDPIVSGLIGLLILPRTWMLLSECTHILMEGAPGDVDTRALRNSLKEVPGVMDIHDLHVWTITSERNAMSAHVAIDNSVSPQEVLAEVSKIAKEKFGLDHTTIQVELVNHHADPREHCE